MTMDIQTIVYVNLGVTTGLGAILLVLPVIFHFHRKRYLKKERQRFL